MYKENKSQNNERFLRQKYIRVIEKFTKRVINLLKSKDVDFQTYETQVIKWYEDFKDVEKIRLNNTYLNQMEAYVDLILQILHNDLEDFEEQKERLLKEANLLHKEKNKTNYKKEKHKQKSYNDGY